MSLEIKDLRKTYRQPDGTALPVLDIPEFSLAQGEQVALIGASGGGKTTLLNVIAGITTPDSGQVVITGVDITRLPEAARDRFRGERIGLIFQTFHLLPAFTALENVLLGMTFARGRASRQQARELLVHVGLEQRLNHRPGQLSVGEQQRVAIARAVANRQQLLLADEPTASVDPANKESILKLITDLCREHQISLLTVTHDHALANRFDRVIQLADFNRVLQLQ